MFRVLRGAATCASTLTCLTVVAVWGWSFREPVARAFDHRDRGAGGRTERCCLIVERGVVTIDNSPEVAAEQAELAAARERLIDSALAHLRRFSHAPLERADVNVPLFQSMFALTPDDVDDAWRGDALALDRAEKAKRAPPWSHALPWPAIPGITLILAVPPGVAMGRWWRTRRRRRLGLCTECAYDVRASPGRCPECGAVAGGGAG